MAEVISGAIGKLCHEEMVKVFGGDFSKDGELGIGRGIWSRGFPETGLSGARVTHEYLVGGLYGLLYMYRDELRKIMQFGWEVVFWGVLGILERSPCRGHFGGVLADNGEPRSTGKVIF